MTAVTEIALAADRLLPQRDLLLNEVEVTRRLSAQLDACGPLKIERCERLRVKYRFGESLRVLYRLRAGGATYHVAARAPFADRPSQDIYRRALAAAVPFGPLPPVFYEPELGTVFWTFPNDRKMKNLRALFYPQESLSREFGLEWTRSRLMAFAPEKCATAQCMNDEENVLAYAKLYSGDEGEGIYRIYKNLHASVRLNDYSLRLPCALHYSKEHRALLLEAVKGARIADLSGRLLTEGFGRLGGALAALHNLPLPDGLPVFRRLEADRLERAAHVIEAARPDVSVQIQSLARKIRERRETAGIARHTVCLHGDVHPKNAILEGDSLTLIDLDQAGVGPAAADLGSLLAALSYNRLVGAISPETERDLARAFLVGYATTRRLPTGGSLRWHAAAALLAERALRAVNRVRQEGLRRLREILIEAEGLLEG